VNKIIKTVLNLPVLSATKFPVGLQSHVEDLIGTSKNYSKQVCRIAICGQGGSGKTTLAKAIFHQIHDTFTDESFVEDIGQFSRIRGDLHLLLEQLLSDLLETKVEIDSVEMGRSMIRERFSRKRVFIVLDDVRKFHTSFVRECCHWFGGGTVIIITARDGYLARRYQVDSVFQVNLMKPNESLELLSWHAFREAKPNKEYDSLARRIVANCGGLPLTLEVIGTYLHQRTKEEWYRVLLKLGKIPELKFDEIFKMSYDGLRNEVEKDLFLDICRSFVGKGRDCATKILNGCGVDADSGIRVLTERNLIKVNKNNKLGMHSMLLEMGKEIISEISGEELWKHRQLLFDRDVKYAFSENRVRTPLSMVLKLLLEVVAFSSAIYMFFLALFI